MALHAIVALGRGHLNEFLCHIDDTDVEVFTLMDVFHQVTTARNNHAVAGFKAEMLAMAGESTMSSIAIGMADLACKLTVADSRQGVIDNDVLNRFH